MQEREAETMMRDALIRLRVLALNGRWEPAVALLRGKVAVEVRRAARAGRPADPIRSAFVDECTFFHSCPL